MQTTLAALRDIEGVLGSFLLDESGQLLARDMPGVFDDETLSSASARLARLRGALESETPSFGGCVARFGEHLLVVRPVATRLLCVLVPRGANLSALQMGTNLVSRRLVNQAPANEMAPISTKPLPPLAASSVPAPARAPSTPIPTPTATVPRASVAAGLAAAGTDLSSLPSTLPAPPEPSLNGLSPMMPLAPLPPLPTAPPPVPLNTTIALLAQAKLAPSDHWSAPQRDSPPLVDPHPTRPLPKRFFRGRPVD
jgi:hypothetical protein